MTSTNTDDTNQYAGPFCSCGDYSCPASADESATCASRDDYTLIDLEDYDQDSDTASTIGEIRYARGSRPWHPTYAQAQ
ncbi:hypothetical protein [Nocardia sp. 348MFTsu5.1]|uniref:hypothetical protein n=1 Tax=Nocardia sp. 348MFTsu5.1 TaxID=1172185 RepID=UPI0003667BC7|nr:hypothetical protein [Nocardia sp. 348MFTsu5.1]